jgi:hypothetical protein
VAEDKLGLTRLLDPEGLSTIDFDFYWTVVKWTINMLIFTLVFSNLKKEEEKE